MTREELIKNLRYIKNINRNSLWQGNTINEAIKSLENQRTGHWIENAPEWQNIDPPYICSECGNFHLQKTNYCDQCGANMKGE